MSGKTLTIWGSLILSTYHMCVCELLNCRSEHVHCKIACYFRPQSWQGNGYVSNLPQRLVNAKLMDKISAQAFDVKTDLDHHPFQRNMHSFPPKPWFRLCMWFRIYIYMYILILYKYVLHIIYYIYIDIIYVIYIYIMLYRYYILYINYLHYYIYIHYMYIIHICILYIHIYILYIYIYIIFIYNIYNII